MIPSFPRTHVSSIVSWSNYSGTIRARSVPVYCSPEGGTDVSILKAHGEAIRAILQYCFSQQPPSAIRAVGSTWSFSKVIEPGRVVLDTANLTHMMRVPPEHFGNDYHARAGAGFTPVFCEGGTGIGSINRRLGKHLGLALQTSGSGDGHRIGGCIATGTHGSAMHVGALHDTVLALYLVVAPDRALLVQAGQKPPFGPTAAGWLEAHTGIPTTLVSDDSLFHAAQVSLGSLGIVFGVVVEATKLYRFRIRRSKHRAGSERVLRAIRTLDTSDLHKDIKRAPHHFDVVMHPYPSGEQPGYFVTLMWKEAADGIPFASPLPGIPRQSSDTMGLIASLAQALGGPLTAPLTLPLLQSLIFGQLDGDAKPPESFGFPGEIFGPTTLPPGTGASTEIAVHQKDAEKAIETVFDVLRTEQPKGRFLLGCVAVRFVGPTRALLGMNQFDKSCFIELPSIRNDDVLSIYETIYDALEKQHIPFTCHWGQLHGLTPARVQAFFKQNAADWVKARRKLLISDAAMQVFAAPLLKQVGLDGG